MTGEQLKEILYQAHVSQVELAEKLGMSKQNFGAALCVADVKSGLLERIAAALGKDMSFFYPASTPTQHQAGDGSQQNSGDNVQQTIGADSEVVSKLLDELSELRKTNQKLMDKLLG